MSESVVLCEGYHDRAFWGGWLKYLELVDPGLAVDRTERVSVFDPWGKKVARGQFGFYSQTGHFVRIEPCHGDVRRILQVARGRLGDELQRRRQGAGESRLHRLVISIDSDADMADLSSANGFKSADLCPWLCQFDPAASAIEGGAVPLFDGTTVVSLVRWEAEGSNVMGIPTKQTLERLVSSAIVAAYPERAESVQRWLESRRNAPEAGPKEYAWSHMAGWYAEFGCTAFYQKLWNDDNVAKHLRSRLEACGAWQVAQQLAK